MMPTSLPNASTHRGAIEKKNHLLARPRPAMRIYMDPEGHKEQRQLWHRDTAHRSRCTRQPAFCWTATGHGENSNLSVGQTGLHRSKDPCGGCVFQASPRELLEKRAFDQFLEVLRKSSSIPPMKNVIPHSLCTKHLNVNSKVKNRAYEWIH